MKNKIYENGIVTLLHQICKILASFVFMLLFLQPTLQKIVAGTGMLEKYSLYTATEGEVEKN